MTTTSTTTTSTEHTDAVVVYESMFGSSRAVAFAIAQGLGCEAVSVAQLGSTVPDVALLVAGAPTHVHGLSRPETRAEAVKWSSDQGRGLTLEPGHDSGMREWLAALDRTSVLVAAFDTRADMPQLFSGAASHSIERSLVKLGATSLEEPESFLVDSHSHLLDGQLGRAFVWGRLLRSLLSERVVVA